MVDGAGAELSEELLGSEGFQVVDEEGPEMEDVVARVAVTLLHYHSFASQQGDLNGSAQTTRPSTDDEYLKKHDYLTIP